MILTIYALLTALIAGFISLSGGKSVVRAFAALFYVIQGAVAVVVLYRGHGLADSGFFTFDSLGMLFHVLLCVISPIVFHCGNVYLRDDSLKHAKTYSISMIFLCLFMTGVYYADNIVVTWVLLEATTICAAFLLYHRRSPKNLEATWKYLFVCSTGIAIAYLGILMLSTAVAPHGAMTYKNIAANIAHANPLYVKVAFLLIFTGFSCKMELFPLYSIGVDANYSAPVPAAALISTTLVNAGFVSIFRVYGMMTGTPSFAWMGKVLLIAGIVSVLIAAVYIARTHNFKRLLAYSTVENMGLVAIALGLGKAGMFAALLHMTVHTFVKGGMFLQMADVSSHYGSLRINRLGSYFAVNRYGAFLVIVGMLALTGMPVSGLFVSEFLILKGMLLSYHWAVLVAVGIILCMIIYFLVGRFTDLCFRPVDLSSLNDFRSNRLMSVLQTGLFAVAVVLVIYRPHFLTDCIDNIINLP